MAPGHGQTAPWPYGAWAPWVLGAMSVSRRRATLALHSGGAVDREGREFLRGVKVSEARREKESCQAKSAWNASCIYLAVRIRQPSALTSSPTTVGGVCTSV